MRRLSLPAAPARLALATSSRLPPHTTNATSPARGLRPAPARCCRSIDPGREGPESRFGSRTTLLAASALGCRLRESRCADTKCRLRRVESIDSGSEEPAPVRSATDSVGTIRAVCARPMDRGVDVATDNDPTLPLMETTFAEAYNRAHARCREARCDDVSTGATGCFELLRPTPSEDGADQRRPYQPPCSGLRLAIHASLTPPSCLRMLPSPRCPHRKLRADSPDLRSHSWRRWPLSHLHRRNPVRPAGALRPPCDDPRLPEPTFRPHARTPDRACDSR
jgi:hypothetical protein